LSLPVRYVSCKQQMSGVLKSNLLVCVF
jgi:hypothetical protein